MSTSATSPMSSSLKRLFAFLTLAIYFGALVHASSGAGNDDLLKREDGTFEIEARGSHIDIPLRRSQPLVRRGDAAEGTQLIKNEVKRVRKKLAKGAAAYQKNHNGKHNPVFNASSLPPLPTITTANTTEGDAAADVDSGKAHRRRRRAAATGTQTVESEDDYSYWQGDVTFGTPAQTVTIDFDTGSSDLILNMNKYYPAKSSTSKAFNKTWSIKYADGTGASGSLYSDLVTVGGRTSKTQGIGVPTKSSFGSDSPSILGMGFQAISQLGRRPLIQNLYAQGTIPKAMFGMALARQASNAEIRIGGYNADKIKKGSSLTWNAVDSSGGYWMVPGAKISFTGSKSGKVVSTATRSLLIDSGTTYIYGSRADVEALYEGLGISTVDDGDCITGYFKNIPTMSFTLSGQTYNLKKHATYAYFDGTYYTGTVVGCDDFGLGADEWLVGDPFLTSVYAVFDASTPRLGFADANF